MAATTLPRAVRIILAALAWGTLPMLGLSVASAFTFPPRVDRAVDTLMMLCFVCAVSQLVQGRQDARIQALTDADNEQKRALIMALDAKGGPDTGPMRLLRDAS